MKIYIYNCNNLNEFLSEVDTDTPNKWKGTSTTVKVKKCRTVGKSYAFNTETEKWDILIDDWRGVTLYSKANSKISKQGKIGVKPEGYTEIAPPDTTNQYVWNEQNEAWEAYTETINPTDIIKQYQNAIQQYIDTVAQARGYDNGYTCASYFGDKNARYAADAQVFKDWRSDIWVYVNNILNQYSSALNGSVSAEDLSNYPTPEQIIAQLPLIEWEEE